ncbi:glycerol kinase [Vibrio ostreicida]|uniref:Glycerol kinase n=1 Tax=Vibrio ostreicida TaxID=526588 RepID=A0ABT8C0U0_9VIBR|nr:glycerol kinase [Vibrio ostreicida]MDN3611977.1 glycerol kinase [Vibrio ostreicida]NPD08848.1 glycerol kinase [Vibrio ostreicida]
MTDKLSTTALARLRGLEAKQLFQDLKRAGYIKRMEEAWILTDLGERCGGEYAQHHQYGQFIVWPEQLHIEAGALGALPLSATQLGERFKLNAKKINQLFQELGWIEKAHSGWKVSYHGLKAGGSQRLDKQSGKHFVVWHDSVVRNKHLKQSVKEFTGQEAHSHATDRSISNFRQKFEAKHRTLDGHYVRSVGELKIDNWLYMNNIAHAYTRQLPIEENILSDFYLPSGKVYLHYWGKDNGDFTEQEKRALKSVYHDHNFDLIEIEAEDIEKLDEVLPSKLREFGISAY